MMGSTDRPSEDMALISKGLGSFSTTLACIFVVSGLLLAVDFNFNLRPLGFLEFPNAYLYGQLGPLPLLYIFSALLRERRRGTTFHGMTYSSFS